MRISEVINELKSMKERYGDIPIVLPVKNQNVQITIDAPKHIQFKKNYANMDNAKRIFKGVDCILISH